MAIFNSYVNVYQGGYFLKRYSESSHFFKPGDHPCAGFFRTISLTQASGFLKVKVSAFLCEKHIIHKEVASKKIQNSQVL